MQQSFTVEIEADPDQVFALVADLSSYGEWLGIVAQAEPENGSGNGTEPAWMVTLRARLGPLARSKRLRMVRTAHHPPRQARFERDEQDGREHSPWALTSIVEPTATGSSLTMTLDYGGGLWSPALRAILDAEVDDATTKLQALARSS